MAIIATVLLCPHPTAAASGNHTDEIKALATLLAMAQTASDRCDDILLDNDRLAKAPGFFHMTPDDNALYRTLAKLEMDRLAAAISAAPSLKAWCDEAYRGYGPGGYVLPDLMLRW